MSWDASDEDTWERWERDRRRRRALESVTLSPRGTCIACDQPPGSNPNRCCLCADVYDKEHP